MRPLSRFALLLGGCLTAAVAVPVSVNIAYGGLTVSVDDLFANLNPPTYHRSGHPRTPHAWRSPSG